MTYDKNAVKYVKFLGFTATDCCRLNPSLHKDTRKQEGLGTIKENFDTDTMLCIKPTITYCYLLHTGCSDIMYIEYIQIKVINSKYYCIS